MTRDEILLLVEDLEAAGPEHEPKLVGDVIEYAVECGWLTADEFQRACKFMIAGAYLDAALLTVPEGWNGQVDFGLSPNSAELWNNRFAPDCVEISVEAETPALALCAASMKALAAQEDAT